MTASADRKPLSRIFEHLRWVATGKGYGAILSLVYLAIVTRSLGPTGYGTFSLILGTTTMLQLVLGFNIWQVLVKYGQEHIQSGNVDALGRLIRFCTTIELATAALGIAISALVLLLGSRALGMADGLALVTFGYAVAMFASLRNVPRGMLRLQHHFKTSSMAEAVVPTIKFAGALIAWLIAPTLSAFLLTWAIAELASTATFWLLALRKFHLQFGRVRTRHWLRAWRENDRLGSLLIATNIGETAHVAGQQLPILLIGFFSGTAGAGLYRLAHQLMQTISLVSGYISMAFYTEMSHVHAKDGLQHLRSLTIRLLLISLGMAGLFVPLVIFLGKSFLLLISGPQFIGAYMFLVVLGVAASIQIVSVSGESLLMSAGYSRTLIAIRLIGMAILLGSLFFLLEDLGSIGAAWAKVLTEAASLVMILACGLHILRKITPAA